jgi:hypothetical protein
LPDCLELDSSERERERERGKGEGGKEEYVKCPV